VKITNIALRVLKILGITILVIIGLVLLPLIIGFIVDLAVTPQWVKAQSETRSYLLSLKSYQFQSASLPFVTRDDNAWWYFHRADQACHMSYKDEDTLVAMTLKGAPFQISEAERLVQTYANVIALWDSGTSCRFCAIPLEYEKGPVMSIDEYGNLVTLARLAVIKGHLELVKGNPLAAAELYAKTLKMGADVGGGGEHLIGRLVGLAIAITALQQAAPDINQFDLKATTYLKEAIGKIEQNWPSLDSAVEVRVRSLLLPGYTGWDGSDLLFLQYIMNNYFIGHDHYNFPVGSRIMHRLLLSYTSWNRLFSVRWSALEGIRKLRSFAKASNAIPDKSWSNVTHFHQMRLNNDFERGAKHLDPSLMAWPMLIELYMYHYENLMAFRTLKAALWLKEYHLNHRNYPESLDAYFSSDINYYDLADREPLHYRFDKADGIIRLYSVGLNLKNDGGEIDKDSWGRHQGHDDIWVELGNPSMIKVGGIPRFLPPFISYAVVY
jgi:hypothetical protein